MLQLTETDAAKPVNFFLTFNLEILTYNDRNRELKNNKHAIVCAGGANYIVLLLVQPYQ